MGWVGVSAWSACNLPASSCSVAISCSGVVRTWSRLGLALGVGLGLGLGSGLGLGLGRRAHARVAEGAAAEAQREGHAAAQLGDDGGVRLGHLLRG